MEAGDCSPLNINAMRAISVKSYLNPLVVHNLMKSAFILQTSDNKNQ